MDKIIIRLIKWDLSLKITLHMICVKINEKKVLKEEITEVREDGLFYWFSSKALGICYLLDGGESETLRLDYNFWLMHIKYAYTHMYKICVCINKMQLVS